MEAASEEESSADGCSEMGEYEQLIEQLEGAASGMSNDSLPIAHLHGTVRIQNEIARPHGLHPDIQVIVSEVIRRGPAGTHQHRSMAMQSARLLSEQTLDHDMTLLSDIDPRIRKVLNTTGDSGAHPAFLQQMLVDYGHGQMDIVQSLLQGFPLVGSIPVEASAKPITVAKASMSFDDLRCRAQRLTSRAVAKQRTQLRSRSIEMCREKSFSKPLTTLLQVESLNGSPSTSIRWRHPLGGLE